MKKRRRIKKKNNVVLFPNLERRLVEKALYSLKNKQYTEAIRFFEEAKAIDPLNEELLFGLVVAYFEAGYFIEAKEAAKELLNSGIGDYFQIVDIYIMILVQLHEHDEIVKTIQSLLEEKEIPDEKVAHFTSLLQFSKKVIEESTEIEKSPQNVEKHQNKDVFSVDGDPKKQMLLIAELANQNIRPYIREITDFLQNHHAHPFLKTMLLNELKEQEYHKEMVVNKFGLTKTVNPVKVHDVRSQPMLKKMILTIREQIENEDPILFENMKTILERHFFLLYPFELEQYQLNVWIAAYHSICLEYIGFEDAQINIAARY
ncbi:tetratricopeptide repeat protein [Bacillus aquiflavi]|nr:tetratricopeptide repeat protein [Bacillus aquiflavi]UAC47442.1 tetratricopeptide repeat protein [Bacillus aquiflavi]